MVLSLAFIHSTFVIEQIKAGERKSSDKLSDVSNSTNISLVHDVIFHFAQHDETTNKSNTEKDSVVSCEFVFFSPGVISRQNNDNMWRRGQ